MDYVLGGKIFAFIIAPIAAWIMITFIDDKGSKLHQYKLQDLQLVKFNFMTKFLIGKRDHINKTITKQLITRNIIGVSLLCWGSLLWIIFSFVQTNDNQLITFGFAMGSLIPGGIVVFGDNRLLSGINTALSEKIRSREDAFYDQYEKALKYIDDFIKNGQIERKTYINFLTPYRRITVYTQSKRLTLVIRYQEAIVPDITLFTRDNKSYIPYGDYKLEEALNVDDQLNELKVIIENYFQ